MIVFARIVYAHSSVIELLDQTTIMWAIFSWMIALFLVFMGLLLVNIRLRKAAFIWFTYLSLTCWYYFRVLEKKYGTPPSATSPRASRASTLTRAQSSAGATKTVTRSYQSEKDVLHFESPEKIKEQERIRSVSERQPNRRSDSSSEHSGYSDDSNSRASRFNTVAEPPKTHMGIFRKLRKSQIGEERRLSDVSSMSGDPLERSSVSESGVTRRTFIGRKKPVSWGD